MNREAFVHTVVFWLAAALVLTAAKVLLLPCLAPFLWGWLAAVALRPAARWLESHTPLRRRSASVLCLLCFWLGAGGAAWRGGGGERGGGLLG